MADRLPSEEHALAIGERRPTTLITVGNLPAKTQFTFANSIRGAWLHFKARRSIERVVILDTEDSIASSDERNHVIRSILGQECAIESIPCLRDFASKAFQTLASELLRPDFDAPIVDVTNGRRHETFSLIVATSLARISDVVMTVVRDGCHATPFDQLVDADYSVAPIGPFAHHRLLESAAQFELIYYTDRMKTIADGLARLDGGALSGVAQRARGHLDHAIIRYFSGQTGDHETALTRMALLLEELAKTLAEEFCGPVNGRLDFASAVGKLQGHGNAVKTAHGDAAYYHWSLLVELLGYARLIRNAVQHPHDPLFTGTDVQFMIFLAFRAIEHVLQAAPFLVPEPANVPGN